MHPKLCNFSLFVLVLSAIQSDCNVIQSESDISKDKQLNKWPSGQWNISKWPNWLPNDWSTLRPHEKIPTIYPPLPDWVFPTLPPGGSQEWKPSSGRPTWKPTRRPTTSTPTTSSPEITNSDSEDSEVTEAPETPKPSTARPPRPSKPTPTPPNQSEDASGITVKSCGLSHVPQLLIGNKIVSGKVAKGGEFPWQVILKIHTARGAMQCGGSILNSKWILTAAHCVSNERNGEPHAQRVDVTAGTHNRVQTSPTSQVRTADCVIQHEGWKGQNGKFKNDIALLRIPSDKPIDITYEKGGNVNGVCLPTTLNSEYNGKARISGWGLTKDRGTPSDVLMYTDVTVLTNDKCKTYQYPVPIADSMICQGVDRTAPCQGDSGGPLVISQADSKGVQRLTEIGVVSFGPGECANARTPNAVYTKVSYFLKWIEKNIKANSGQKCMSRELMSAEKWGVVMQNITTGANDVTTQMSPVFEF